jgi:hypothetical protein
MRIVKKKKQVIQDKIAKKDIEKCLGAIILAHVAPNSPFDTSLGIIAIIFIIFILAIAFSRK